VGNLSGHFKPEGYHDEYQARLQSLLDAKLKGKKAHVTAERKLAPVVDMMEALKKSLAKREQASPRMTRQATTGSRGTRTRRKAS
jgi:DNA end-binding protein Ku